MSFEPTTRAGTGMAAAAVLDRDQLRRAAAAKSDNRDGDRAPLEERFLDAHLARCARCRTHEGELAAALEELRAGFAAPAETPAVEAAPPRARLRVVPPAPMLPPAPEPPALEPAPPPL